MGSEMCIRDSLATVLTLATAISTTQALRARRAERDARAAAEAYRLRDYTTTLGAAHGALRTGDVDRARRLLALAPADLRGFEWRHLRARTDRSLDTWPISADAVQGLAWVPGSDRVVVAARDGTVELRAADGERVSLLRPPGTGVRVLAVDPRGGRAAAALFGGEIALLDLAGGGGETLISAHAGAVTCLDFTADGRRLVSGGTDGAVRLWRAPGFELEHELAVAGTPSDVVFLSGETRLAVGLSAGSIEVRDLATGRTDLRLLEGAAAQLGQIAVSPDGRLLAGAWHDGVVRAWALPGGEPAAVMRGHTAVTEVLAFAPGGARLASGGWDRGIRLWDARDGAPLARLLGHAVPITCLAWSPDGTELLSGDEHGWVKRWSPEAGDVALVEVRGRWDWRLRFAPGSPVLASVHGGFAELRDPETGRVLVEVPRRASAVPGSRPGWSAVDFDPRGGRLALGDTEGWLSIRDAAGALATESFALEGGISRLAWSPDGTVLAAGGLAGRVVRTTPGGAAAGPPLELGSPVAGLAFARGGTLVAGAENVDVFLVGSGGEPVRHRLPSGVSALALDPTGERLALGLLSGEILLVDPEGGTVAARLAGHRGPVRDLAWSPDGSRIASASDDRSFRLWDPARSIEVWAGDEHGSFVHALAFSPGGERLATASVDGTLRLWDTREPRAGRAAHPEELALVAWMRALAPSPDAAELEAALALVEERLAAGAREPGPLRGLLRARAALALALDRSAEALEALDARAAIEPEPPVLAALRAIALARLGRREEAGEALARARADRTPGASASVLGRLVREASLALSR